MTTLWQDIRYGIRQIARSPAFTATAVLTLALGIGANTALFSVVYGVLLKPLPLPQQDRLVTLSEGSRQVPGMSISYPDFLDWRTQQTCFAAIGVLACWLPARRAARMDPMEALRCE